MKNDALKMKNRSSVVPVEARILGAELFPYRMPAFAGMTLFVLIVFIPVVI